LRLLRVGDIQAKLDISHDMFPTGVDCGDSESSSVFHFHIVVLRSLAIVCSAQSNGSFGDSLAVRLLAQDLESARTNPRVSAVAKGVQSVN
jgi:hypothetical protein